MIKYNKIFYITNLLILITLFSCTNKENTKILFTLNGTNHYAEDFFLYYDQESFLNKNFNEKSEIVNNYILYKLIIDEAERLNLHIKNNIIGIDYFMDNLLVDAVIEEKVWKPLLNQRNLEILYSKLSKEIGVKHIVMPFKGCHRNNTDRSKEETLLLINDIRKKINENEISFSEAAKNHSNDPSSINGGNLGYFRWGKLFEPIQSVAFKINLREISEPILSRFGYHLVYVYGVRNIALPDFENYIDDMESFLRKLESPEFYNAFNKFEQTIDENHEIWINEQFLDRIYKELSLENDKKLYMKSILNYQDLGTIAKVDDQLLTIQWLKDELKKNNPVVNSKIKKTKDLIINIQDIIYRYITRLESIHLENKQLVEIKNKAFIQYAKTLRNKLINLKTNTINNVTIQSFEDSLRLANSIIINETFLKNNN
tara:strand:+ start:1895 stop:3181 length:1287 start_codon:yes stop_codon:yes gene_type:complete